MVFLRASNRFQNRFQKLVLKQLKYSFPSSNNFILKDCHSGNGFAAPQILSFLTFLGKVGQVGHYFILNYIIILTHICYDL